MSERCKEGKYTEEEQKIGEWIRDLSARSYRGWKAFYHTREWKKKRTEILERDHYGCTMCRAKGKYTRADTVHHVKHLKDAPELALDDGNLMSLCASCHDEVHKGETRDGRERFSTPERW